MKRTLCLFLALILAVGICFSAPVTITASAATAESDFEYEENIAKINNLIDPTLETIYFRTNNAAISSSMIKEFLTYHLDVSQYVPKEVLKIL